MTLHYFAYGSNMHPARLRERVGPAALIATARVPAFRLAFHKRGHDGSGKCDIVHTGVEWDCVHGVVFEIDARQKRLLDGFEGLGHGYKETELTVDTDGGARRVLSYRAQDGYVDASVAPFEWYKALVLQAARLHRFPAAYLRAIERVPSARDPDPARDCLHRRLLQAPAGSSPRRTRPARG